MDAMRLGFFVRGDEIVRDGVRVGEFLCNANALDRSTWPARVRSTMVVVRSGFVDGANEHYSDTPLWLAQPRAEWAGFAKHVEQLCGEGVVPVVWARSGDVISDAPSTLSFVRGSPKWKFLADPAAVITPQMRGDAGEHIERLADLMLAHSACVGVVHPGTVFDGTAMAMLGRAVESLGLAWWRVE